jgi:hypothetical protein
MQITSNSFFLKNKNVVLYKGIYTKSIQTMFSDENGSSDSDEFAALRMQETIKTYYEK